MRSIYQYAKQMQCDTDSLLPQQYDQAIIGFDLNTAKFVYDVDRLQEILTKDEKVDDALNYMDKNFFSLENKPVYFCKLNKNEAKQSLKVIAWFKNNR